MAGPELTTATVGVAPDGRVAFSGAFDAAGQLLAVMDTSGIVGARFGRSGEGPGEFRQPPVKIVFPGSTVLVDHRGTTLSVSEFTVDGRYVRSYRYHVGEMPLRFDGDSIDVAHGFENGTDHIDIRRYSLRSMKGRVVIAAGDSAFRALTRKGSDTVEFVYPVFAASADEIIVANPYTYQLQAYDPTGRLMYALDRDVPPRLRTPLELDEARRKIENVVRRGFVGPGGQRIIPRGAARALERLPTDTLRHFGVGTGMHFDGRGRLWVVGEANDSSFADVFLRGKLLGRMMLGCRAPRSSSLNGEWLALVCSADAGSEREVDLHLYKIVEGQSD